jgi:hypothetical protein
MAHEYKSNKTSKNTAHQYHTRVASALTLALRSDDAKALAEICLNKRSQYHRSLIQEAEQLRTMEQAAFARLPRCV